MNEAYDGHNIKRPGAADSDPGPAPGGLVLMQAQRNAAMGGAV
jgi:hypothetical protein